MATKAASNHGGPSPHTAGIFADMTVDGPEVGTLVVIVDRAKNLPNKKTMGKQNPYCAARLGKEAKKTETDKRGGQTPRWDQELRFTVHDSPDYHTLKISVFSEDKRTDLIGEAWVNLEDVIVPGGGKSDMWQGLNTKGKYAGELRIELTYYDMRPKPESVSGAEDMRQTSGAGMKEKVKRRPLPSADGMPEPAAPGRAKHGPRELKGPGRANSMPPEDTAPTQPPPPPSQSHQPAQPHPLQHSQTQPAYAGPGQMYGAGGQHHPPAPHSKYTNEYDPYQGSEPRDELFFEQPHPEQPDFLPQLPPSNRQRNPHSRYGMRQGQPPPQARPHSHVGLPHSQSAPLVPTTHPEQHGYDDDYQMSTDYPEAIPDVEYQHQQLASRQKRNDVPPQWQTEYGDPYANRQPYVEDENPAPPPPPMHSNSAPIVPQQMSAHGSAASAGHGATLPHGRHYSVSSTSPLHGDGQEHGRPLRRPLPHQTARGMSMDEYGSPHELDEYGSSPSFGHGQVAAPVPYGRPQALGRPAPHNRHSVADPYGMPQPRAHPLSQEVPRARSPQPYYGEMEYAEPHQNGHPHYQQDYRGRDPMPAVTARSASPLPAPQPPSQPFAATRPRSSYDLQHPIHAFESSDASPLSTSQQPPRMAQPSARTTPRKSVSPRPSPSASTGTIPFSPDSFDVHNPNARPTLVEQSSPNNPYQVRPGSDSHPTDNPRGPIVGWHGQEIDPSDHLPVASWAPEPDPKPPGKTYGLGRDRDFGPRSGAPPGLSPTNPANPANPSARNLSKDTIVNFRNKSSPVAPAPHPEPEPESKPPGIRARLNPKKSPRMPPQQVPSQQPPLARPEPQHFHSAPDPYAPPPRAAEPWYPQPQQQQQHHAPHHAHPHPHPQHPGALVPVSQQQQQHYGPDALAREIESIDIGAPAGAPGGGRHGRGGSLPPGGGYGVGGSAPTAFVPVRSHRERGVFY